MTTVVFRDPRAGLTPRGGITIAAAGWGRTKMFTGRSRGASAARFRHFRGVESSRRGIVPQKSR
jgi:hypothetical protein